MEHRVGYEDSVLVVVEVYLLEAHRIGRIQVIRFLVEAYWIADSS